jgi:hypothetical protein
MQLRDVLVITYFELKQIQINIPICPANTIAEQNGQKYSYRLILTEIVTSELMQLRDVLVIAYFEIKQTHLHSDHSIKHHSIRKWAEIVTG